MDYFFIANHFFWPGVFEFFLFVRNNEDQKHVAFVHLTEAGAYPQLPTQPKCF